jgi:hypothetical protein
MAARKQAERAAAAHILRKVPQGRRAHSRDKRSKDRNNRDRARKPKDPSPNRSAISSRGASRRTTPVRARDLDRPSGPHPSARPNKVARLLHRLMRCRLAQLLRRRTQRPIVFSLEISLARNRAIFLGQNK